MRRIEFIEPVKAMRGNLTGKTALQYAQNNNPAFYAPEGKQFARNYGPSYIGNKRASDGHKFFSVKTKSATKIDAATLLQMASFGATGALIGSMYSQKAKQAYIAANAVYVLAKQKDPTIGSFRQWLSGLVSEMFKSKTDGFTVFETTPAGVVVTLEIENIFNSFTESETVGAELSPAIMVKFWKQLANNPVYYKVAGLTTPLIAHLGQSFNELFDMPYNVLKLEAGEAISGEIPVKVPYGDASYFLTVRDGSGVVGHDHSCISDESVNVNAGDSYYLSSTFITGE